MNRQRFMGAGRERGHCLIAIALRAAFGWLSPLRSGSCPPSKKWRRSRYEEKSGEESPRSSQSRSTQRKWQQRLMPPAREPPTKRPKRPLLSSGSPLSQNCQESRQQRLFGKVCEPAGLITPHAAKVKSVNERAVAHADLLALCYRQQARRSIRV